MTPAPPALPRVWSRSARVESAALALMVACGLGAWAWGISTRGYDYDEVTRAHSAWLASTGLRPYDDFFECHPPYFALLAPLIRARPDPVDALTALRGFAGVGNLLFLLGLGAIGASISPEGRRWAWLGLGAVAFHPSVLEYLVEFRVDGWGYAITAWALVLRRRRPPGPRREFEFGAITGVATLLLCPKLTILPALVVVAGQIPGVREAPGRASRAFRAVGAYGLGLVVAAGLFLLYLATQGITPARMAQLLVRYHAVGGSNAGFRLGLFRGIVDHPWPAALVALGFLAWACDRLRTRARFDAYEVALAIWLGAQAMLVAYPYKQYYAPWFLFASGYLGALGRVPVPPCRWARPLIFLAASAATGLVALRAAESWSRLGEAVEQARLIRWMGAVAGPGDRVVASPPMHPVDRPDTFFVWFNTADPNGFDSERILARLPSYRDKVAPSQFLAELEAHPPALVAISGDWRMVPYTAGQSAALSAFLPRRGYRIVQSGAARFAVRPDRLETARKAR